MATVLMCVDYKNHDKKKRSNTAGALFRVRVEAMPRVVSVGRESANKKAPFGAIII
jgi:hypothetical protein